MEIVISGGTGFIGQNLARAFITKGYNVTILTRGSEKIENNIKYIHWNPDGNSEIEGIEKADVVVNLAGFSIASKRWSPYVKKELKESRINSTRSLVKSMEKMGNPKFISASAVGYYGFRKDEIIDETAPPGNDFLATLAADWEKEALSYKSNDKSIIRLGIVIGEGGGILDKFLTPVKLSISKKIGNGKQWISWVDIEDVIGAINFIIENKVYGIFNLTSPNPLTNEEFLKVITEVIGKKQYLSVPSFMIKILLGELGESLIMNGQRVIPKNLQKLGYQFKYPELRDSISRVLNKN